MTKEQFVTYITKPHLLAGADLTVLTRLTEQYPYSANAQLLLAIAAELSDHPRREAFFQRAASITFDRAHLYDTLQELTVKANAAVPEEEIGSFSLEDLMAPEALSFDAQPTPAQAIDELRLARPTPASEPTPNFEEEASPVNDTEAPSRGDGPKTDPPSVAIDERTDPGQQQRGARPATGAEPAQPPQPVPAPATPVKAGAKPTNNDLASTTEEPPGEEATYLPPASPQDPADFIVRRPIGSREELRARLESIRRRQMEEAKLEKRSVKKIARRSLIASDGIISATLAEVFIQQGQYQHAIQIYEQLALANPEKRPIFAALIQDLKHNFAPDS